MKERTYIEETINNQIPDSYPTQLARTYMQDVEITYICPVGLELNYNSIIHSQCLQE